MVKTKRQDEAESVEATGGGDRREDGLGRGAL